VSSSTRLIASSQGVGGNELFHVGVVPILLGREDFLSYYTVSIDHRAETVELQCYPYGAATSVG
jgi:hypothetical protein